jgi:hypothetical protein
MKRDNRKGYPMGTRGAVRIEAETNEPQTLARGREFAKIVGDAMVEARQLVESRLRQAGFADLNVWIDLGETDITYWFGTDIAIDVYETRMRMADNE